MKVRTYISLPRELIRAIDQRAGQYRNRSEFIERAVQFFIAQLVREEQNARDLEILNRRADFLNQEAADVLTYQVAL